MGKLWLVALGSVLIAGCASSPHDAADRPSDTPLLDGAIVVTPDGATIARPDFRGPLVVAARVETNQPVSCTGSAFAIAVRPVGGVAGLSMVGDRLRVEGTDTIGVTGGGTDATLQGLLGEETGWPVGANLTVDLPPGESWVWFYASDVAATRFGGQEIGGVSYAFHCPGSEVRVFAGDQAVPVSWRGQGDVGASALFGNAFWVAAASPVRMQTQAPHVFVGVASGFFGTDARLVLQGPQGISIGELSAERGGRDSFVQQGGPGSYELRAVSKGDQPQGAILAAQVTDLQGWFDARSAVSSGP